MIRTVSSDYFPSLSLSDCPWWPKLYFEIGNVFLINLKSCLEELTGNTNLFICYRQWLIFLLMFEYLSACYLFVSLLPSVALDIWKDFLWLVPLRSMQKWNSIPRHANGAFINKSNDKHAPCRVTKLWVARTVIIFFFNQLKIEHINSLPRVL